VVNTAPRANVSGDARGRRAVGGATGQCRGLIDHGWGCCGLGLGSCSRLRRWWVGLATALGLGLVERLGGGDLPTRGGRVPERARLRDWCGLRLRGDDRSGRLLGEEGLGPEAGSPPSPASISTITNRAAVLMFPPETAMTIFFGSLLRFSPTGRPWDLDWVTSPATSNSSLNG
jgi:hypothetical protein